MTPEIKKRIEDIKAGIVPEGYKRAKHLGIYPKEWKVGKLEDVLYNVQRPVNKPTEPYWRLGVRSWAKGTFQSLVDDPSSVAMDELYKVRENDLIVNITFAWEHAIAIAKKEDDGMLVSHRFPTYVFKLGNVPDYYQAVISQPLFKKMLENISPGGAGRNRVLNRNDFLKLPCYILPTEEQKRIADILSEHDKIISLCDKKLENLRLFKKACLQKMFPKKGSNVPEIRFPGFTDPWEQRKFSDVVEIGSGMDYKHLGEGDIPVYGTGGYMLSVDAALSEDKDAIGIGRKGTIDKPYILKAPFWTVDTLFYCIPKEKHDLDFTNCLFQNVDWKKKDESTGVPSLSKVIINNVATAVPSFGEQKKIGEYFKTIDNLITLHQRKCDLEREKKKALMQLLLTGIVRT